MTPSASPESRLLPVLRDQVRRLREAITQRHNAETNAESAYAQTSAEINAYQEEAAQIASENLEASDEAIQTQLQRIALAREQMAEVLQACEITWKPPKPTPAARRRKTPQTLEGLSALADLAEKQPGLVRRMNPWSAKPYLPTFLLVGIVIFVLVGLGVSAYQKGQEGVGIFLALCGMGVALSLTIGFGIAASNATRDEFRVPMITASLAGLVVFVLVGFFHERWTESWFLIALGPAVFGAILPLFLGVTLGEYSRTVALVRARRVIAAEGQALRLASDLRDEAEQLHRDQMAELANQREQDEAEADRVRQTTLDAVQVVWFEALREIDRETRLALRAVSAPPDESAPFSLPTELRFGELTLDLAWLPDGVSPDPRFAAADWSEPVIPALQMFPHLSLLIQCDEQSKTTATRCVQAYLFRLLTTLPPGKVRFTFFDPTGLGENFAAFMHLGDHDEALVTSRVWTETRQIEEQLARVTEHMAEVIQKYLRGQYQSIDEYNAQAGEVAEPYRFVVVAGFPAAFSPSAAARLLSIATVGPRCGVYLVLTRDMGMSLPPDFGVREFEQTFTRLVWDGAAFHWDDPDFAPWPVWCDEPPSPQRLAVILNQIGRQAVEGSRVRVPFDFVAPRAEERWASDSREGLVVPVGRAGATKRHCFCLGQGTAQHALVAGRTGSGKSTFLHALIVSLALSYGPDEVELYLIDFKKGVEFKTYATHGLPHARVVAIESDREFGLSVLQRLDQELHARGDAFRGHGVQDIATYRRTQPSSRLPRVLLIVDEFQELFVEDDRIATEASQLLDRLVRQGRAFGIHVVLGSQTLGGVATLARSTIDQMAVRIALQCSDADARLILDDNNTAAGLLSRPGEAIYNDASGREEGNSLFQVVWLPDAQRETLLTRLSQMAREAGFVPPHPCVVYEGNVPADLSRNHLLTSGTAPVTSRVWRVWLGESVAIKDPTAAVFRPQSASNLLLVGQQADLAQGLTHAILVCLGVQHHRCTPPGASVVLFDGTPADSPRVDQLHDLARMLPCPVQEVDRRRVSITLTEIRAQVDDRLAAEQLTGPALFVVLHGIQYFRELRDADTQRDLLRILRDGPVVSIHMVLWCDTLTNLRRVLDDSALQEFEMRGVMQMSQQDSLTLMDSPAASQVGTSRAYFHHEERGMAEKFRPYVVPDAAGLRRVADLLRPGVSQ